MNEIYVAQLRPGQEVNGIFSLRSLKLLTFRDGSGYYLAAILGDRTGQVEGRVWEAAQEIYQNSRTGDIVSVQGRTTEYNGKVQIQITAMSACQNSEIDPGRFIPTGKLDVETAGKRFNALIDSLKDPHLKGLLALIFTDESFNNTFFIAPAAKRNHHAAIGGLAEHSLGVAAAAEQVAGVYPGLDRDLLIAGALLHDMGKVEEYRLGTDIDFTDEGRLLGHIVLGVRLLDQYIRRLPDFPADIRLKLTHMIVSLHGQYEWQSPKRPKFLEAAVLHHLDMIDVAVNMFRSAVENRENKADAWAGWVKGLERPVFCK
ncbi:MAG: HD domain-containing protein [Heliobacteriaceae bacterium]|nr:HD domain-containing protein [Heliobacteriaceae bacterium]